MTNLHLGLTLAIVGPRGQLLNEPDWPMALRITVGTDVEPVDAAAQRELVEKTVPWVLWETLAGAKLRMAFAHPVLSEIAYETFDVKTSPAENPQFLEQVHKEVVKNALTLVDQGLLRFALGAAVGEPVIDEDEEARTGRPRERPETLEAREPVSWPGLLATFQTLTPPTPSALHVVWYFTVPREHLANKQGDGSWIHKDLLISAAPMVVQGASCDISGIDVQPDPKHPVHVYKYQGSGAKSFCQSLRLSSVLEHRNVDEMDDFWLAIRNSGDESLMDLGPSLDTACAPAAVLAVLSVEELLPAMEVQVLDSLRTVLDRRAPTAIEASAAVREWKSQLAAGANPAALRVRLLKAAATARQNQAEAARAELRLVAREQLRMLVAVVLKDGGAVVAFDAGGTAANDLEQLAELRLFPRDSRASSESTKPLLPKAIEGVELVVGDPSRRLRHVDLDDDNAIDDVAQIQLFARRSSEVTGLDLEATEVGGAPWHSLSAVRYRLADTGHLSEPRVVGATATYLDDVLSRDLPYNGTNMAASNSLAGTNREQSDDDQSELHSFVLAGLAREACTDEGLKTAPLRYGDHYEFAAAVVDRSGGMAKELTGSFPWEPDLAKIPKLNPPQRDRVAFTRRIGVGECNISPGPLTSWPQTPSGVELRCTEKVVAVPEESQHKTIFLVPSDSKRFLVPDSGPRPPQRYAFRVDLPCVSEHVVQRWNMPATTLPQADRESAAVALQAQLSDIYLRRDEILQRKKEMGAVLSVALDEPEDYLPTDPAVAAIGLAWRFDSGKEGVLDFAAGEEFLVACGDASAQVSPVSFKLAEGDFLHLRYFALVREDQLQRFSAATLQACMAPPQDQHWPDHKAFRATDVFAECATNALPTAEQENLLLKTDAQGNVQVSYLFDRHQSLDSALFRHITQVHFKSDRWGWRNLPLPPEDDYVGTPDDLMRRLASGPPADLFDESKRDASKALDSFDTLSGIDAGFAGRPDKVVPSPQNVDRPVLLWVDEREGHAQADYLHYAVSFSSRYAPILKKPRNDWSHKRRIAIGFRGDLSRIKPPRVLAVLPLTQSFAPPGAKDGKGGCAFLVILDENWFREYGVGERLVARIARVKPEIPETDEQPPDQARFGPLPDHRLDAAAMRVEPHQVLDVFGPFGLGHDRGGSQALANATAFVVYAPKDTPPHFNLFVEFARVLDKPTSRAGHAPLSDYTEAVALYTLPDMEAIALGSEADPLVIKPMKEGWRCEGAHKLLPFKEARDPDKREVLEQYRYALVVGHHVRDGGRAVDVFLPSDAMWLTPTGKGDEVDASWMGTAPPKTGFNAAVVFEIELNGRYPDAHPLQDARSIKELLRRVLDDSAVPKDAAGWPRRICQSFPVRFE